MDGPDLREIASLELRFPIKGVNALRLPKQTAAAGAFLAACGPDQALLWTALTDPASRVPLAPAAIGGARRAAAVAAVEGPSGEVLAAAVLAVLPGASRHAPPELVSLELRQAADDDAMLDLLAWLWADADPAARAAAPGAAAVWLGGNLSTAAGAETAVSGAGAAFGLVVEAVPDAHRRVRQVAVRLAEGPPEYLMVWQPHAYGTEDAVQAYRSATAEGEVIVLDEPALDDALLELRYALAEMGLAEAGGEPSPEAGRVPPKPGEERFYVKGRGSKTGDVMIDVADCGHGKWGSDVRRLAPRAYKGIWHGEGVAPKSLYRCASCGKHRWRARY